MDNLSNYLKEQYAAQKEQELSQLKNAYDKNLQTLAEKSAGIPAQYEAAKNETAVQNAIAKKNFNEQAAATGLNTGTSGQAELSRSNAYMSALSKLNRSEAEVNQALERDRLSLQTEYENAIAAQKAASDAALQSALYQEMVRQQNAKYQAERDAIADAQWQKQFDEAVRQYEQDYAFTQQKYLDALNASAAAASNSSNSGNTTTATTYNSGGYDTHGYSTEQIKRLQKAAGIDVDGIWGPQTQAAYDAGYRPSVELTQQMLAETKGINSYGTTAEEGVRKMIANGESEDRIFAYIDELTRANYLTPSENTNIKLKIRSNKL